jgi:PAS domain S-box-containing protein
MNPDLQKPPTPKPLILLFLVLTISTIIAGVFYYNFHKTRLIEDEKRELTAITDLKIRQITQWRFERLADARFMSEGIMLGNSFLGVTDISDSFIPAVLTGRLLQSLSRNFDYSYCTLFDYRGHALATYPPGSSHDTGKIRKIVYIIRKDHKPVIDDFQIKGNRAGHLLDLIIPLATDVEQDTTLKGFLLLEIDPAKVLFPLIASWPVPSKSAESILVTWNGDETIFLSPPRFSRDTAGSARAHKQAGRPGTVMNLRAGQSDMEAIDYRSVPVIAAVRKIPGTQWYLISKIDKSEVISELNSEMSLIITVLVLFIASTGLFLGFLLWFQRVRFYREKYEDELDRLALFRHFDYILKFANDIILLIDTGLKIAEANDRALETYQFNRKEFIGLNIEEIQSPVAKGETGRKLREIKSEGNSTFETIHKRKNGTEFPLEISSRLVDIEGTAYYQIIGRDITDRKNAELSLKESEQRFRKIFEESPFPMVITGKDTVFLRANASFCDMTGFNEPELKQYTLGELTHPEDGGDDPVEMMRLLAGDIPLYQREKRYIKKDGTVILGATTVSILRNNTGEVQYFIGMIEDITEKKKAESDLIAAKLRAEESDRLKTAFLHNVSHEIRTPMNAIIGFSSLLNEPDIGETDRIQYTGIIYQSSGQLLSIINDIVDVANIESGQVKLNLARTDLNFSLKSLSGQYSYSGKQHKIPIHLTTGLPDDEAVVMTDNTKLIQVLSNLINNSIKFTKKGKIEFGYTLRASRLEFFVNDTGIGIPEESIGKIFDRFYQVDRTVSRQFGGTGLGLSICKAYVNLLGGSISVTSSPGKGTSFIFDIPYVKAV